MMVESIIPPIPAMPVGVKLGLSNIVIMYTIFFLGNKSAFTLLVLKSLFIFLTRGATAFLMSFFGGLSSIIIILLLLLKNKHLPYIMISVYAAIGHNIGQLIVSSFLLSNLLAFYYAPILIVSGVVMGLITGSILKIILPAMKRVSLIK